MDVSKYTRKELIQLYRDGLINPSIIQASDINEKVKSLPHQKLSHKVRQVAYDMKKSTRTIYRALALFK